MRDAMSADAALERKEEANEAMIAKKDFVITHNDYRREIKTGDDLSDVPPIYLENLKTEGVL